MAASRRSWVSAALRVRASSGRWPWRRRGCLLHEDVVVVVDEMVMLVEVVESEAEERAVGDGGGPWASGAGVGC